MMGFALLEYLHAKGHLGPGTKMLDVGSQNLMNCSLEGMLSLAEKFAPLTDASREAIARQFYYSVPRPGEQTLFVGEYLNTAGIDYRGIDVCPAPFTDIVDLNWQRVPHDRRGEFDLVLNLGTTEHVIDQTNSHAYIHDSTRVGGVMFHQPPSIGWPNHGYFTYHPQFYYDLAVANEYEILDMWYSQSSGGGRFDESIPHRPAANHLADNMPAPAEPRVGYFNLNVVFRKTVDKPFRSKLELATSHSAVDQITGHAYGQGMDIVALHDQEAESAAVRELKQKLAAAEERARAFHGAESDSAQAVLMAQLHEAIKGIESIADSLPRYHDSVVEQIHAAAQPLSSQVHEVGQTISRQIYEAEASLKHSDDALWANVSKHVHDVGQPLSGQVYDLQLAVAELKPYVTKRGVFARMMSRLGISKS